MLAFTDLALLLFINMETELNLIKKHKLMAVEFAISDVLFSFF